MSSFPCQPQKGSGPPSLGGSLSVTAASAARHRGTGRWRRPQDCQLTLLTASRGGSGPVSPAGHTCPPAWATSSRVCRARSGRPGRPPQGSLPHLPHHLPIHSAVDRRPAAGQAVGSKGNRPQPRIPFVDLAASPSREETAMAGVEGTHSVALGVSENSEEAGSRPTRLPGRPGQPCIPPAPGCPVIPP